MKSTKPSVRLRPAGSAWRFVALAVLLAAAGGLVLHLQAPGSPAASENAEVDARAAADPAARPAAASTASDLPAPAPAALDQRPAMLPPGILLVATQPGAQPPQATLWLDGQLQGLVQDAPVAGSVLRLREVMADAVTLGLAQGPALYTLQRSPADEVRRHMADARAARLAERAAAPGSMVPGDRVVQQDAGQTTPLPQEMQVTVRRRVPGGPGPVGGI